MEITGTENQTIIYKKMKSLHAKVNELKSEEQKLKNEYKKLLVKFSNNKFRDEIDFKIEKAKILYALISNRRKYKDHEFEYKILEQKIELLNIRQNQIAGIISVPRYFDLIPPNKYAYDRLEILRELEYYKNTLGLINIYNKHVAPVKNRLNINIENYGYESCLSKIDSLSMKLYNFDKDYEYNFIKSQLRRGKIDDLTAKNSMLELDKKYNQRTNIIR